MIRSMLLCLVLTACGEDMPTCIPHHGTWVPLEQGGTVLCGATHTPPLNPQEVCRTYHLREEGAKEVTGPFVTCPPIWECAVCEGTEVYSESYATYRHRINNNHRLPY